MQHFTHHWLCRGYNIDCHPVCPHWIAEKGLCIARFNCTCPKELSPKTLAQNTQRCCIMKCTGSYKCTCSQAQAGLSSTLCIQRTSTDPPSMPWVFCSLTKQGGATILQLHWIPSFSLRNPSRMATSSKTHCISSFLSHL